MITIHLIVKNNEKTIGFSLESLSSLNANILIGDLGCKDKTISICESFGANVVKISLNDDMSKARNYLSTQSKTNWNMYIEPWEILLSGQESINEIVKRSPKNYKLSIIQNDVVTKQTRIWNKETGAYFANPIFETLKGDSEDLKAYISAGVKPNLDLQLELVEKWRDRFPLSTEPIYYTACTHLQNKNWDSFINFANLYLHQEKKDTMSVHMTNYYCSMVNCYIKKDFSKAIEHLIVCLAKKPTMAEFWCLLADIYYETKNYDKAKSFYTNAILLGSKRLNSDSWPLEISKYKDYPNKMIDNCNKIKQSLRFYATKDEIDLL